MPSKPLRPCNKIGCSKLTRVRYCEDHKQLNNDYDNNRGKYYERGYGHKWRKARKVFLAQNRICVSCGDAATEVDHIVPHKGDMSLFWNVSNWQSLCKSCHSSKTVKEDGGFGHR